MHKAIWGSWVAVSALLAVSAASEAATLRWSGLGTSALWSEAANWDLLAQPADGDLLVFGAGASQTTSVLDLTRSFAALLFDARAPAYALHVQGSGAVLGFGGAAAPGGVGIRNATAGSGPIRQDLFADAGAVGGSIVFSGQAGVNLGDASALRPVNLTAGGGSSATAIGGHIVFQDQAATSDSTFDQLRAEGASAVGGVGGEIVFRGQAVATRQARLSLTGGSVAGASGARASFADQARADALVNVLAGDAGGLGGRVEFSGTAIASAQASFNNQGGRSASSGAQGSTRFAGDAVLSGSVVNEAGTLAGASGGLTEFRDHARHDTSGANPALGLVQIINSGATVAGARGGRTVFSDDAAVLGSALAIVNAVQSEGVQAGASGGSTQFDGRADAGEARITNQGFRDAALAGFAIGGRTLFLDQSSAGRARITNQAGDGFGDTNFFGQAGAADATLDNLGGASGRSGGGTRFNGNSRAERAVIVNGAGARGLNGFDANGFTAFVDQASAGQARITAQGAAAGTDVGGLVTFSGNADPASATLVADGGSGGGGGGRIVLAGLTNSSQARVVLNAGSTTASGGQLDISGLAAGGVAIGSLEGGGLVNLGGKRLVVWNGAASTTFAGLLRDGGQAGGLDLYGGATLTLTGANTNSGGTRIGDGVTLDSGKLVVANSTGSATGTGPVLVQRGGTLAGSGSISGPVTLLADGMIAPGDPVTLTLAGGLTWIGGGVIRLALGADDAGSDHLVTSQLQRGPGSGFRFELVDLGVVAGGRYALVQFDSLVGFSADDFSVSGLAGTLALQGGQLAFTAAAVPEPATLLLWLTGVLGLAAAARAWPPGRAAGALVWRPPVPGSGTVLATQCRG